MNLKANNMDLACLILSFDVEKRQDINVLTYMEANQALVPDCFLNILKESGL